MSSSARQNTQAGIRFNSEPDDFSHCPDCGDTAVHVTDLDSSDEFTGSGDYGCEGCRKLFDLPCPECQRSFGRHYSGPCTH